MGSRLREYEVLALFSAIVVICFTIGLSIQNVQTATTARACIAAGGSWTDSSSSVSRGDVQDHPAGCSQP